MKKPYEIKQIIVIRHDLKLGPGKIASQAAHASMHFLTKKFLPENKLNVGIIDTNTRTYGIQLKEVEEKWLDESFAKIVVYVKSPQEIHDLHAKALEAGIEANMIIDSGHTCFNGVPTLTALALGPDTAEKLDPITRGLPLL